MFPLDLYETINDSQDISKNKLLHVIAEYNTIGKLMSDGLQIGALRRKILEQLLH